MKRTVENEILEWFSSSKKALLIDGARQVGKTYAVRAFARKYIKKFIEINFYENTAARDLVNMAKSSEEILLYLSTICGENLVRGETVIFFDEVQECDDIITAVKFLVEEGSFRYILSGSMLGIEMKNIRSVPVGYLNLLHMYPMTFYEFCLANGVGKIALDHLKKSFDEIIPVQDAVHEKFMKLYHLYLIVGGMPAVVQKYLDSNNLKLVEQEQLSIIELYKKDISKYDKNSKLYLAAVYDLIPSELNSQNKRFMVGDIKDGIKFDRTKDAFIWLVDAGVAVSVYCANEPKVPLILSKSRNLLKLFLSDVGLLAAMYANNIQIKILKQELDINFGGIYENAVAQELYANGIATYYYKNNRIGELDFVCEINGECVPIEVKSGKNYQKHSALSNVLKSEAYDIKNAIVFNNYNVSRDKNIIYYPIYMAMFLRNSRIGEYVYKLDLSDLS